MQLGFSFYSNFKKQKKTWPLNILGKINNKHPPPTKKYTINLYKVILKNNLPWKSVSKILSKPTIDDSDFAYTANLLSVTVYICWLDSY